MGKQPMHLGSIPPLLGRLLEAIRQLFADKSNTLSISASIGVVLCRGGTAELPSQLDHRRHRAEQAMYCAKPAGKNRIAVVCMDCGQPRLEADGSPDHPG